MPETPPPIEEAAAIVGEDQVAEGTSSDAIAGVVPQLVASPGDVGAVSRLLAWANARRLAVVPVGGGTKVAWGSVPPKIDVALSTRRLTALVEHRHADLTATVEAGATLAAVNQTLDLHGQWIACDPSWPDRATIGGILATNDSGPSRYRFGAPRDLLIGITFVTADGTLAHAGGRVVKNVAGYDLGKLLVGSHGSLGVIVEATFKLLPRARTSRTVEVESPSPQGLTSFARTVASSQISPIALELAWPPSRALVRFESVEEAVTRQAESACEMAHGCGASARILDGEEAAACWRLHATRPWAGDAAVVALGLPASQVGDELVWLGRTGQERRVELSAMGRLALGSLRLSVTGAEDDQIAVLRDLRARRADQSGHVLLLRGGTRLRRAFDPWGPLGDAAAIMRAIKARFDPNGILSRGRWPGADEVSG